MYSSLNLLRLALGGLDEVARPAGEADLEAALLLRQPVELGRHLLGDALRIGPDLLEQRGDQAALLLGEREEDMLGQHFRLPGPGRQVLRSDERFACLDGQFVESHGCFGR